MDESLYQFTHTLLFIMYFLVWAKVANCVAEPIITRATAPDEPVIINLHNLESCMQFAKSR